jgi:hypothetical protein
MWPYITAIGMQNQQGGLFAVFLGAALLMLVVA